MAGCPTCPAISQPASTAVLPVRGASGYRQRSAGSLLRDDGPSTSGRGAASAEAHRTTRSGSLRPQAYLQSSRGYSGRRGTQASEDVVDPSRSSSLGSSSQQLLAPSSLSQQQQQQQLTPPRTTVVAAAAAAPGASLVHEQGGAFLLQLVAAWDQLASRLPPEAGAGRASEVILNALKLAVAYAPAAPASSGGQPQLARPVARALSLASRLADLAAAGLPIDAESIAAGILAEVLLAGTHPASPAASAGAAPWHPSDTLASSSSSGGSSRGSAGVLTLAVIEERAGPIVAQLVHDVQRARQLPSRVELLDDTAAAALRELCLSFYDVRATAVEVVARLDALTTPGALPSYEQQVAALEALQMYAPMGHALGLSAVAAQLEDRCFQILFPESYLRTAAWLRDQAVSNADVLARCTARLAAAVERDPRFAELAGGLEVQGRTKTLFSTLKKLLRLGNTAAGGRARAQLYDIMGLRAIVAPRTDLPPEEAEELAARACYLVKEAACSQWECIEGRSKDYIAAPKSNGYQSLHSAVRVSSQTVSVSLDGSMDGEDGGGAEGQAGEVSSHATLELQIRTQAMHERAEMGDAAHAAYKGGLDAGQARQLKAVTDAVLRRAAAAAAAATAGPGPSSGPASGSSGAAAAAEAGGSASSSSRSASSSSRSASSSSGSEAAAERLFRHLDQNGDGRISLEELQFALQELGVQEAQEQSRAAAELLQLAASVSSSSGEGGSEGAAEDDGTIGFDAFMAFQRRVGLFQAISTVDHQQAHLLEEQQQQQAMVEAGSFYPGASSSGSLSSSDDGMLFADAADRRWGSGAASSSSRFAAGAAACRALSRGVRRGSVLGWQPQGQQPQLAAARWGCQRGSGLAARAFTETSSSSDSIDVDADLRDGSHHSSSSSRSASSASSSSSSGANPSNNVVALQERRPGEAEGSSHSSGNGSGAADSAASPTEGLLSKPQRPGPATAAAAYTPAAAADQVPPGDGADEASRRNATAVWRASRTMQGIMRLVSQQGPPPADATWQLVPVPSNRHRLVDAAGAPLPTAPVALSGGDASGRSQVLRVPGQGPCVIGAVLDRDCDFVLDVPTVSGRHARLEVVRRRDAKGGYSKLVVTDLGSTNGTRVNRAHVETNKEVALHPGDVLCLAEAHISFEVQVVVGQPAPSAPSAASSSTGSEAAGAPPAEAQPAAAAEAERAAAAGLPPVVAALRVAGALEDAAAAQGLFPPGGAVDGSSVPDRARQLMTAGKYEQAHALLLAGAMQQPWAGGLWAQLANLERQRARRGERGGSYGAARAFFRAAAAAFGALGPAGAGGLLQAGAECAEGQSRVLSSWAQMELQLGHASSARTLFRLAIVAAREHPAGAAAAGAPRLLFIWAHKEWKAGEPAAAQRLCAEALELDPANAYALALLGNIEAEAGQTAAARRLLQRALEVDPAYVTALQSLARLEAANGNLPGARDLFKRAAAQEPRNTFVLQAWAVAEARGGDAQEARSLFKRCTDIDPACRPALHAWAKLEDDCGRTEAARQLYTSALALRPGCLHTLSSLGRLERKAGDLAAAERSLQEALAKDPHHVASVHELALVREAQGRGAESLHLQSQAKRLNSSLKASAREVAALKLPATVAAAVAGSDQPSA